MPPGTRDQHVQGAGRQAWRVLGKGTLQAVFLAPGAGGEEAGAGGGNGAEKGPRDLGARARGLGVDSGVGVPTSLSRAVKAKKQTCGPCWKFAVFASAGGRRTEAFRAVGVSVAADVAHTVLEVSPRRARCLRLGLGSRCGAHSLLLPRSS